MQPYPCGAKGEIFKVILSNTNLTNYLLPIYLVSYGSDIHVEFYTYDILILGYVL